MGEYQASERDVRNTIIQALMKRRSNIIDWGESLCNSYTSNKNSYDFFKNKYSQKPDSITEIERDYSQIFHDLQKNLDAQKIEHEEIINVIQIITPSIKNGSMAELALSITTNNLKSIIRKGLKDIQSELEISREEKPDMGEPGYIEQILSSYEKYRLNSDEYADITQWLKMVAVDKWLSGELIFNEQLQETSAVEKTFECSEELENKKTVEPMADKTPVNTVDLTMHSKKYVFENSGALIFKDDFARRTDTIDAAVKAFREKYKENSGITSEEIDEKYFAQGGWGVPEFEQEVKLHICSIILAVKVALDDLRGTFVSNGIDGEFIGKIRTNLKEDLDIPGEKEDAVKYYLALKETQEWLERDFCTDETIHNTKSDSTSPIIEKQKTKKAIAFDGDYVINNQEISINLLLATREFIEKRKIENHPKPTNCEHLTGISGECWFHVFQEFKEKIDNASAFDLNALELWGPIIKKAGYSTTDELFNQHATLINLFEFAAEEKMNEIRNERNLTVEYIKQNIEKKRYGLQYDIAVDSFLALKAANDWLTELMRKKEEGSNAIESEKAIKKQPIFQTSNKNEANHPSSSINQKRIPDYKKNRSWTQFVQNKNILEEFEKICDKEGCTTKKQIVDEFWIVYGNELDGKKSGLYDVCCNNEKANKFLEQVISEHKKAK